MQLLFKFSSVFFLVATLFVSGCGGDSIYGDDGTTSSGGDGGSGDGGGTDGGGTGSGAEGVSYLPLMVLERHKEFSGSDQDDLFQGEGTDPHIWHYMVNPVDAATLAPVSTATESDFLTTVSAEGDDPESISSESYPMLQKVVGNPITLNTALVFDLSGSTDGLTANEIDKLIAELKDYLSKARASSNSSIKNQTYTVWTFSDTGNELTSGFTINNGTNIEAMLDSVATSLKTEFSLTTDLYRGVIEAMGRYRDSEDDPIYNFRDDGDNDLVDRITANGINLTQLILFSTGEHTPHQSTFNKELIVDAIESQSLLRYPGTTAKNLSIDEMDLLKKPVFYYVPKGQIAVAEQDATLAENSEVVRTIDLAQSTVDFADTLIQDQIRAITDRVTAENQYVYRFAFTGRDGEFTVVFSSNSAGNSYSLTSKVSTKKDPSDPEYIPPLGTPYEELATVLEVTGANDAYIANADPVAGTNRVSISDVNRFYPKLRWVDGIQSPSFTWVSRPTSSTINSDGSVTVNAISGSSETLTLRYTGGGISTGDLSITLVP
ncbi:hypothetical protein [Gynuella sp.]|uniref:hypothetical protein n=1 Tax=Gynuella sp. TaxID=2969146 RepID=UPI003D0A9B7B